MSPILDSIGSVKGFGWGALVGEVGSYDLIQTVTSDGSTAQFYFTSIPQTYRYLEIRGYGANGTNSAYRNVSMRVNGEAGYIYRWRFIVSNNNSMSGAASSGATEMPLLQSWSYNPQNMGVGHWIISDYASTSKAKTFISAGGASQSSGTEGELSYAIGTASTTSPITSIMIFNPTANTWVSGTEFSLYGVG